MKGGYNRQTTRRCFRILPYDRTRHPHEIKESTWRGRACPAPDKSVRARVKALTVNPQMKDAYVCIGRFEKFGKSCITLRSFTGSGIRRCNNLHSRSRKMTSFYQQNLCSRKHACLQNNIALTACSINLNAAHELRVFRFWELFGV